MFPEACRKDLLPRTTRERRLRLPEKYTIFAGRSLAPRPGTLSTFSTGHMSFIEKMRRSIPYFLAALLAIHTVALADTITLAPAEGGELTAWHVAGPFVHPMEPETFHEEGLPTLGGEPHSPRSGEGVRNLLRPSGRKGSRPRPRTGRGNTPTRAPVLNGKIAWQFDGSIPGPSSKARNSTLPSASICGFEIQSRHAPGIPGAGSPP